MKMNIKTVMKEVYVTSDGQEFTDLTLAQEYVSDQIHKKNVDWLADLIEDAGGYRDDFDSEKAARWIIDNIYFIQDHITSTI